METRGAPGIQTGSLHTSPPTGRVIKTFTWASVLLCGDGHPQTELFKCTEKGRLVHGPPRRVHREK